MRLVVLTNRVNFRLRDDTRQPHEARVDTNELQGRSNKRRRKKKKEGWEAKLYENEKKAKKKEVRRSCAKGNTKACVCLSTSFRFSFYAYSLHVFPSSHGR